jgi:hypothetical protein
MKKKKKSSNNSRANNPNKGGRSVANVSSSKYRQRSSIITSRTSRYTTEPPLSREVRLTLTREQLPNETVLQVRHRPDIVFTQMDGYRRIDIIRQ